MSSGETAGVAAPLRVHTSRRPTQRYPFPYFVDYFKHWFLANPAFGATRDDRYRLLFTGGLQIITTLDPELPGVAQDGRELGPGLPGDPDGAMTVIDPRTGYVRAMVGATRRLLAGHERPGG